jgi:transcriptional regulator with XRE-family HTH domain
VLEHAAEDTTMPSAKDALNLAGLGQFIRERRRVLKLTQSELATRLGWVQEKISALECRKYGMPALPALAALAKSLDVSLYDVLAAVGNTDERRAMDRDRVQVAATEVPAAGRPISARAQLQGTRTLAQESN